ncbi:MAG TPA: chloride channel protein [Polyangiaceae bacterium]|nr:chloride channel protein [Polyangiaceae bacterium]
MRRIRALLRLRTLYLLRAELRFAPSESQRLLALTGAVGVACGFAAVAFHLAIRMLEDKLIDPAMGATGWSWMLWTIATPTIGALGCGVLLQYVFPNARGSGIPQVKIAFAREGGVLRMRDSIGKFLVGALQIGSGSSLGREGPTVQICAGIASRLGRLAKVSPTSLRRLLPVGAAAGIAAAFNAPIAAVTFTIEEVVGTLDQTVLSGVIVAAALAAVIERSVLGEHPVFDVPQTYGLHHASSLLVYALIGAASAIAGVTFTDSLLGLRGRFRRMHAIPVWARPGIGGFVTGVLAVAVLRFLHVRGVTGGGYETLDNALTGALTVRVMAVLCAAKLVATVAAYASGGAGGIFAPALFIGGTLGGAIGTLDQTVLGHVDEPIGAFALVGMGAVFAAIIRAPMTSVLIIIEMTGGYSLILPLMIANMTAYVLARHWRPTPIYEALLEQDGIHLKAQDPAGAPDAIRLGPIVEHAGAFPSFSPATLAKDVTRISSGSRPRDVYPVVDAANLVGIITADDLALLASEPALVVLTTASDIMRPPVSVHPDDNLRAALDAMVAIGAREVPVTERDGKFVGFVDEATVARAYLRAHRAKRDSQ